MSEFYNFLTDYLGQEEAHAIFQAALSAMHFHRAVYVHGDWTGAVNDLYNIASDLPRPQPDLLSLIYTPEFLGMRLTQAEALELAKSNPDRVYRNPTSKSP